MGRRFEGFFSRTVRLRHVHERAPMSDTIRVFFVVVAFFIGWESVFYGFCCAFFAALERRISRDYNKWPSGGQLTRFFSTTATR